MGNNKHLGIHSLIVKILLNQQQCISSFVSLLCWCLCEVSPRGERLQEGGLRRSLERPPGLQEPFYMLIISFKKISEGVYFGPRSKLLSTL